MRFFKRLFCNHKEIDMNNLSEPLCKECGYRFPIFVLKDWGFETNPKVEKWIFMRNLPKYKELAKALKDQGKI